MTQRRGIGRREVLLGAALAGALGGGEAASAAPPASSPVVPPVVPARGDRHPLLIPGKRSLFQRVIVRPGTMLVSRPGGSGGENVPGFSVFYVYARDPSGWLEVGTGSAGQTKGWIAADKAIDWRHAMIGAFTNPAGRQPVLFFKDAEAAKRMILAPDPAAAMTRARQDLAAGHAGAIVAREPEQFVDISRSFYLLPILSAELIERESGASPRLVEVISAPDAPPANPAPTDALRDFKAAVVFVIDTTLSMQPYIDATREAVRSFVGRISHTALKDKFRFGIVAYRDSLEDTAALEYPTRVYARPDFRQPADAVLRTIGDIQQARVSSQGFDEDPIGGLNTAISGIDWNGLSGRYVVLVTDAGARPANHPHSLTHLGIPEIRQEALAHRITPMVVHLLTPEGARAHDHEHAQAQYQALTEAGAAGSLYFPVSDGNPTRFRQIVDTLVTAVLQQVSAITHVPVADLQQGAPPAASDPQAGRIRAQMQILAEATRLAYVGEVERTQAPDVAHSWTCDRDLAHAEVAALSVRVLLTRNQLSDLAGALKIILEKGLAGRTAPETFFDQLRTAFAAVGSGDAQRLAQIAQASNIGGLLGEYLDGLPYKSELLDIGQEDWLAMGSIGQRNILNNVESRLRLYQAFEQQTDLWRDITHGGHAGEMAYPVPIEALP